MKMELRKVFFLLFLFFVCFTGTYSLLSPDVNFMKVGELSGYEADRYNWLKHPCRRACKDDARPKKCYYKFILSSFISMSSKTCYNCPFNVKDCFRPHCLPADGAVKYITVINKQLPGPHVEVCLGDTIVADVYNNLNSEGTTIHWHGLNQKTAPYMDGVPFITQCPILPHHWFRYTFNATESGTFWWHSHVGAQRGDGVFGPLIVHQQESNNPHKNLYDFDEHSMMMLDWKHVTANEFIARVHYESPLTKPQSILVNGLGRNQPYKKPNGEIIFTPDAVFEVQKGYRYRFRLVNAGAENCPMEISIDNHTMTVISTDGHDIEPVEVDIIHIWAGERYDFIINANQAVDNYWFRYRGNGKLCKKSEIDRLYQVAILRYKDAKIEEPKAPIDPRLPIVTEKTRELNPYEKGTESPEAVSLPNLKTLEPDDPSNTREPDVKFYLDLDFYPINNYEFDREGLYGIEEANVTSPAIPGTFQFNHMSFDFPKHPMLSQREKIVPSLLCNDSKVDREQCIKKHCICTHTLKVRLNDVVEMVLIDRGEFDLTNHPLHLHGQPFRIVAMENLPGKVTKQRIKDLDKKGLIKRQLDRNIIKDTVKVPSGGYTIIRFYANNPGFWFFHCHFEQHIVMGLALVIQVGEDDEMIPVPKGFPTCGDDYMPEI